MVSYDSPSNKIVVLILSALVSLIVILVVAIVVVHNTMSNNTSTQEGAGERFEMSGVALNDCEDIERAYNGGLISEDVARQYYDELYEKFDDNYYRVRLTLCFVDNMYNKDYDLDKAVEGLKKIEPLIEAQDDWIDYYDRLVVYYVNAEDMDEARHYIGLRDRFFPIEDYNSGSILYSSNDSDINIGPEIGDNDVDNKNGNGEENE